VVEGKRKAGRRKKTWIQCVNEDMRELKLDRRDVESQNLGASGVLGNRTTGVIALIIGLVALSEALWRCHIIRTGQNVAQLLSLVFSSVDVSSNLLLVKNNLFKHWLDHSCSLCHATDGNR